MDDDEFRHFNSSDDDGGAAAGAGGAVGPPGRVDLELARQEVEEARHYMLFIASLPPPLSCILGTDAVESHEEAIADLHELQEAARKAKHHGTAPRVHWEHVHPDFVRSFTRFHCYDDLYRAATLLLPHHSVVYGRMGSKLSRVDALGLLCARLASPARWVEYRKVLGYHPSKSIDIVQTVADILQIQWHGRLLFITDEMLALRDKFADAIRARGSPYRRCIGFIDGTLRPIARPTRGQATMFSGHHRTHDLSFQAVITPEGLLRDVTGPWHGRAHDSRILRESGLLDRMETFCESDDPDDNYYIYGDRAYGLESRYLQSAIRAPHDDRERRLNRIMSSLRDAVEHGFGMVTNHWRFLRDSDRQQSLESPVALYFRDAVLLSNVLTCLYQNQVGRYYDLRAPLLEDYLHPHNMVALPRDHYSFGREGRQED